MSTRQKKMMLNILTKYGKGCLHTLVFVNLFKEREKLAVKSTNSQTTNYATEFRINLIIISNQRFSCYI